MVRETDLERITRRLAELEKETPRTLVCIHYKEPEAHELYLAVGFLNNVGITYISLDNCISISSSTKPLREPDKINILKASFVNYVLLSVMDKYRRR